VDVAFSPDGTRLASITGVGVGGLNVWDAATGQLLFALKSGNSVAFSPDGSRLVSTTADKVEMWDIATAQEIGTLKGRSSSVVSVVFSPMEKCLQRVTVRW